MQGTWELKWVVPEYDETNEEMTEITGKGAGKEGQSFDQIMSECYGVLDQLPSFTLLVPDDGEPRFEINGEGNRDLANTGVLTDFEAKDGKWKATVFFDCWIGGERGTGELSLRQGDDTRIHLTGTYDADKARANLKCAFAGMVEMMIMGAVVTFGIGWTLKKITPDETHVFHRLDSTGARRSAMDKYIEDGLAAAPEMMAKMDVVLRDAIAHNGEGGMAEISTMIAEKGLAITNEMQRENIEALWAEYDADASGDLSLEQATKLLCDCIVLTGKNCEDIMDRKLELMLKSATETGLMAVKEEMKQEFPSEEALETEFAKQFPPGWMLRSLRYQLKILSRSKMLDALKKSLGEMEADKENLAKKLFEELDRNHDGKVSRDEFTSHFTSACAQVLNMEKLMLGGKGLM